MTMQVQRKWPETLRSPHELLLLNPKPYLAVDLEWHPRTNTPFIIGASDATRTVSCDWEPGKGYLQELLERFPASRVVGHYFLSADRPVLEEHGIHIPVDRIEDSILWHWLGNMNLAKGAKKADDEEGERRGRGWMNLFAACSLHLAVPNWKECVGEEQCLSEGRPCPEHSPFDYNGQDNHQLALAFPHMKRRAQLMGTDRLYPLHRDLAVVLDKIRTKGLLVNREYVERLRGDFRKDCERLKAELPFNPDSPKQVREYFKGQGIRLDDAKQESIEEACEESENPELHKLLDYGRLGNGPDRWFAPKAWDYVKSKWKGYVDGDGYIHSNLSPFTSTGRLASSNPNLQNISHRPKKFEKDPKNTLAARIRRAIVAPEGYYIYESDLSNAENRVMLHLAGHTAPPGVDLHTWVSEIAGFKPEDPFCLKEGSPRQAAKTVQHGNFYGEGISLISREELRSNRIQSEISKGVRIVYPDWTFNGKIVTFTGINFSERAFGSATYDNRKRANEIIGRLFGRFPGVRKLQQSISQQIERDRCVRNSFGYCLPLYGYDPEKIKIGLAFHGSNPIAHITKLTLIRADGHPHLDARLQIHDSILWYVDRRHDPKLVTKWIREVMEVPLSELDNLVVPVDIKFGTTWADTEKVKNV